MLFCRHMKRIGSALSRSSAEYPFFLLLLLRFASQGQWSSPRYSYDDASATAPEPPPNKQTNKRSLVLLSAGSLDTQLSTIDSVQTDRQAGRRCCCSFEACAFCRDNCVLGVGRVLLCDAESERVLVGPREDKEEGGQHPPPPSRLLSPKKL